MKKITSLLLFLISLALAFPGCKKEKNKPGETDAETQTQISTQANDQSQASSEFDAVTADATIVLESYPEASGNNSVLEELICDASVDIVSGDEGTTTTITYNGNDCSPLRTRTGKIIITLAKGTQWKTAGASVDLEYVNLKITHPGTQSSITINGHKTYTNVSGGTLYQLILGGTLKHTITSDGLSLKFDNETARTWRVAREYTFTNSNGMVISIAGLHSENGVSGIVDWGTNRYGQAFTTRITAPLVLKQSCDFRVTSGAALYTTDLYDAKVVFGLDADGNPTGCQQAGKYFYRLEWVGRRGFTGNASIAY